MESSMKIAKSAVCATLLLVCASPTPSMADASTFCLYSLLVGSHQVVTHCGGSLDAASEKRYRDLLAAARDNLIRNDRGGETLDKMRANLDSYERRSASNVAIRGDICKTQVYPDNRKMLETFTSVKYGESLLVKLRSNRDDPFKGDCI
jgi:hypothetical protein